MAGTETPQFSFAACHSASPVYKKGLEKGCIELIKLRNALLKIFRRLRTQVKIF